MAGQIAFDFFLAYAQPDRRTAEDLHSLLARKARVFLDHKNLLPGDDWDLELARAQRASRISVLLISTHTTNAFYQREEIAAAIAHAREDPEAHRVVPVYLEPIDPNQLPYRYGLRHKQGIALDADNSPESVAELLLDLLSRLPGPSRADSADAGMPPPQAAPTPVRRSQLSSRGMVRLCGRERELAELRDALSSLVDESRRHDCVQMILIGGESGVGKSALALAAAGLSEELGFDAVRVVCEPFHEGMSFFPVREIIRQVARGVTPVQALVRFYGTDSLQVTLGRLAEQPSAEPVQRRDAVIATFASLLLGRYQEGAPGNSPPLLVLIDDLERIDAASADALLCLLARLREGPLMVIGAYRTDLVESTLSGSHPLKLLLAAVRRSPNRARVLRVEALRKDQLPAITEIILGGPCALPARFYDRLYQETEGNPLFIREILRSLSRGDERSPIDLVDGRWRILRRDQVWKTPETVEEAIRGRLDLLEPGERAELEVAAVIGRRFAFSVILQLTEASETELLEHIESFLDLDIIRETSIGDETFEFSHGKIRDVLYESMSKIRRRRVHGEIAEVLQKLPGVLGADYDALVGEHLYQAGRYADAEPLLLAAARAALRLQAGAEAANLFQKALIAGERVHSGENESRFGIKLEMAEALKWSNDYERVREICLEIITDPTESVHRGWALNGLGDVYATQGKTEAAVEAYTHAEAIGRRMEIPELLLEVAADLCELHDRESERLSGGEPEPVDYHRGMSDLYLEEQLRLAEVCGSPVARSRALRNRAKKERSEGRLEEALKSYESAIAISDPRVATHSVLISYAKTLRFVGRYDDAWKVVDRVMEWSTQTGARRSLAIAYQYRGLLRMEIAGRATEEARQDIENALELHAEVAFARGEREASILMGEWFLRAGKVDPALFQFRKAAGRADIASDEVVQIVCEQLRSASELKRAGELAELWAGLSKT